MDRCCSSKMCIGSFSKRNFPPYDLKGLQKRLLNLAGNKTGQIEPGSSGGPYLTFHIDGTDCYVALNCDWEAVRFFAERVLSFCGITEGPMGGRILKLDGISVSDYPKKYCIYQQYAQRKK
jgi:hypothetical protein